jgi:6-phosphogluconolactonase (cycloisomerase 2 family)
MTTMRSRAMVFVAMGLTVGLVAVGYAAGAFQLKDSEAVSSPGDALISKRRTQTFVFVNDFAAGLMITYRRELDGTLTLIGSRPVGNEPRQIAPARNGDYVVVVNSSEDQIAAFRIGDDGLPTEVDRVSSGGDNPFDVAVGFEHIVIVADRDSDSVKLFEITRRGKLLQTGGAPTGIDPHVVAVSRNTDFATPLPGIGAAAIGVEKVVLVAVANQTSQSISLFRMNKAGTLTDLGDIPLGKPPRALSWLDTRLFVALDEPGLPLPGTPEDFIRSFEIGVDGTVRQGPDTPAGYFLTDIEATKKGLFAVTVNLNGSAPDKDEVRVYKIDDLSLTLDAAIQTPGASPSFKQIATGPTEKPFDRHVIVSEFQGGFVRSLLYDKNP